MGDMKQMGIPIVLDTERNLIFNLNVLEKCLERYGSMDALLNEPLDNIASTKWLAVQMLNEDAEIYNEEHPGSPKELLTEKKLGRMADGAGGIRELLELLGKKCREAMLKGLPQDAIEEAEEIEKNFIATQSQKIPKTNREQRRHQDK